LELLIPSLVFLSVLYFFRAVQARWEPVKVDIRGRLGQVIVAEEIPDARIKELKRPLSERILLPVLGKISGMVGKLLPAGMIKNLEPKVTQAGITGGLSVSEILGIKAILAAGLPALMYMLDVNSGSGAARMVILLLIALFIGWKLPDAYLAKLIADRKHILEKTFPDILDLLTVSVEAGLAFDGAMSKVVEKDSGLVSQEFRRVLQEIKMGKSRREALRDFANRSAVDDINSFVNAMIQSDQLGLSIAGTLRNQSELMRRKRRQRVEERAMKAPVKMLIPLVVFIFPTIFVILLGPAMIQLFEWLM
jgi:tight adherence protein C